MTNPTPHGQVPEALINLIDAYAETRHRCGGIYNAKTEAARKTVIEALSGVQALSAASAEYVGNGMFKGETIKKAAEHWANWCDVRCMTGLSEFLRVVAASPTPPAEQAAPKAAPGEPSNWPETCDGKEQEAWEAWASRNKYDMREHPLHYLFLHSETDAARQGWKAGLQYAVDQMRKAAPQQGPLTCDTLYLLRRLLSNQHTLTGSEFRAELEKIVGEAYQQEAQEPAYAEACNLATALFKKHYASSPDYASGAVVWGLCDTTAGVISQIDNMASCLVQPAPAPLSESEYKRGYRDGYERRDAEVRGALV